MREPHGEVIGVNASIAGIGDEAARFAGAAVLRRRAHPLHGGDVLQLGVPDDALGFRPRQGSTYRVRFVDPKAPDGSTRSCTAHAAWLDRVGSSWWFILDEP